MFDELPGIGRPYELQDGGTEGVIASGRDRSNRSGAAAAHEAAHRPPSLTPTQLKVLRCVHSGLPNRQIADELGIAESTVKVHVTALMRRLNVRNRTQVAVAVSALGIQL